MPRDGPHAEVMTLLERTGALKRGHFVLSSGLHSDRYCQCAALFERPDAGARVAELMRDRLADQARPDGVVAPALGGVLWGYELARVLGVRSLFAERVDGRLRLRRGFALREGERVLLAEDVVTTGGSVLELADLVEGLGAGVVGVAAIVDRSRPEFVRRLAGRFPFHALVELEFETYPADDVPDELTAIPVERPGSREER